MSIIEYILRIVIGLPAQTVKLLRLFGSPALRAHVLFHGLTHLLRNADAVTVEPITAMLATDIEPVSNEIKCTN